MDVKDARAEHFGSWLRKQLAQRRWSQAHFARLLRRNPGIVGNWVRGDRLPTTESLEDIADVLGLKARDLAVIAGRLPDEASFDDPVGDKIELLSKLQKVSLADPTRVMVLNTLLDQMLEQDRQNEAS